MHTEPRNGATIERIYIHTNEGPETEGGARALLAYLHTIDGGYHVIVDDKETVQAAPDNEIVWGEGGDNTHALSVCLIGSASQSTAQWADPYSASAINLAAQVVANWCKQYGVPVQHVAPGAPGQAPTQRGIAEHADDHAPSSQGHTDPGPAFPIDAFIARVAFHVRGDLAVLAEWAREVSAAPLRYEEQSWKVTALKQLLALKGHDVHNDTTRYGDLLVAAVHAFKVQHSVPNQDGKVFGADAVKALFALFA